jgi:hypothetical protein
LAKALEIIIDQEKDIVLFMGHTFLLKDQIKALPGARWNAKDKVWFAPFSKNSIESLKNHFPSAIMAGAGLASVVENKDEVTDKKVTDEQIDKDYLSVASLLESVQKCFSKSISCGYKSLWCCKGLESSWEWKNIF